MSARIARSIEPLRRRVERLIDLLPARFSAKEKAFFVKRLAFLIAGDVPILECLWLLRRQGSSRRSARVLDAIIADVENGKTLSESLQKFPGMFDDFAINIIRVGETSGILSANLTYLAEELKKKQELVRKVVGALIYPALVTVATLSITIFLTVYLFPKIMPVFLSLNMRLPMSTRIVIAVSIFLRKRGVILLAAIAGATAALVFLHRRSPAFRRRLQAAQLNLPIVGKMFKFYHLANFSRTLGLLLKGGVTLTDGLSIASETSANLIYKREFAAMGAAVSRGESLASYLQGRAGLFTDILPQMVEVGERSGNLSNSLLYISDFYEHEVDDFSKTLSGLVEPALMVGMGVLIGFIAISIITPIYGITQNLHP